MVFPPPPTQVAHDPRHVFISHPTHLVSLLRTFCSSTSPLPESTIRSALLSSLSVSPLCYCPPSSGFLSSICDMSPLSGGQLRGTKATSNLRHILRFLCACVCVFSAAITIWRPPEFICENFLRLMSSATSHRPIGGDFCVACSSYGGWTVICMQRYNRARSN